MYFVSVRVFYRDRSTTIIKVNGKSLRDKHCNHTVNQTHSLATRRKSKTFDFSIMYILHSVALLYAMTMTLKNTTKLLKKQMLSPKKSISLIKDVLEMYHITPNVNFMAYPANRGPVDAILAKYFTQNPPTKTEVMEQEMLRVCTLHDFPKQSGQSCIRLAQAGFYFEGNDDELVCFSCGVHIRGWIPSHNAFQRHRQMSSDCRFIQDLSNVQTNNESTSEVENGLAGADSGMYANGSV